MYDFVELERKTALYDEDATLIAVF